MQSESKIRSFGLFLLAWIITSSAPVFATTLLGMDIDDVAARAEMVFEGEVIHHQAQRDSTGIINTFLTFRILDLIKGDYSGETIELKFAGGKMDGEIVEVAGSSIPPLGEVGIYFVESASKNMLNPLLGWSQGHFVIKSDSGTRRVHTVGDQPVTQVQPVANIPVTIKAPQVLIQGKEGIAAGVSVSTSPLTSNEALSVDEFKRRIMDLIEQ